jgi:hypothetical protein
LLDLILPADAIDTSASVTRAFDQRYGLRPKPLLVRFRILDERLHLHGLSDLSVPVAEFAQLDIPVTRVFMTENDVNGLAFPAVPQAIVIVGRERAAGAGTDCLRLVDPGGGRHRKGSTRRRATVCLISRLSSANAL